MPDNAQVPALVPAAIERRVRTKVCMMCGTEGARLYPAGLRCDEDSPGALRRAAEQDPAAVRDRAVARLAAWETPNAAAVTVAGTRPGPATAGGARRVTRWNPATRRHSWRDGEPHWHHCNFCGVAVQNRSVHGSGAWFKVWSWPEGGPSGAVGGDTLEGRLPKCPGPPQGWPGQEEPV